MEARLYTALGGDRLPTPEGFELTTHTRNWRTPDTVEGTLLGVGDLIGDVLPRATHLAIFDDTDSATPIFSGFVTRSPWVPGQDTIDVQATSWAGWPTQTEAVKSYKYVDTDPAYIVAALYCQSCDPLIDAPTGFTYAATETPLKYGGKKAVDGDPSFADNPVLVSTTEPTNLGSLAAAIENAAGIINTETHEPDWQRTPFTTIHAHYHPEPDRPGTTFALGENIIKAPVMEITAAQMATQHIYLGEGEGADREVTVAEVTRNAPRSTTAVEDMTAWKTGRSLKRQAPAAAFTTAKAAPFDELTVLTTHEFASAEQIRPGVIVTVDLGQAGVYPNLLITSVTTASATDPVATVRLEYWKGWPTTDG